MSDVVRSSTTDVAREIIKKELTPIVREAITDEVLASINDLLSITPAAVQALREDIDGDDPVLRQRAYSLLIKYTVGHPALVKSDDTKDKTPMVVNFNLPRPESRDSGLDIDGDYVEPLELKVCDICEEEKPAGEFVAGSTRCVDCFAEWKAKVVAEFT